MSTKVQIFDSDDRPYLEWLDQNPGGYVVNTERSMSPNCMVLHRATCPYISQYSSTAKRGGFTERQYIKVCADDIESLGDWIRRQGRPDGSFSSEKCTCLR